MKKRLVATAAILLALNAYADVGIDQPWVRGTVPAQKATGAFMQLHADADARLVAASSPAAAEVQIHEMAMVDNVMRMRQIDGLEIARGARVELRPGGYHLMLMGLKQPLVAGQTVPLTLVFSDAKGKRFTRTVQAPVRGLADGAPAAAASHGAQQH